MSGNWTPGPWAIGESGEKLFFVANRNGVPICEMTYRGDLDAACLIAAAPELYELAHLVHSSFGGGRVITFSDDDIARFDAVLAKARGEA